MYEDRQTIIDRESIRNATMIGLSRGCGIKPPKWTNDNYIAAQMKITPRKKRKKPIMVRIDRAMLIGGATALGILALESILGILFW